MDTNHFLIVYRPPRATFVDDATAAESAAVGEHFEYLKKLLSEDALILAGRSEEAARAVISGTLARGDMGDDPTVLALAEQLGVR